MIFSKSLLLCISLFVCSPLARYSGRLPSHAGNAGFALVELFTSEGCSSCPAAERVLSQLQDERLPNVYVMEFHVDYWNNLGWKDVFSSTEYTKRQQHYASAFNLTSTYTPQAIVNGKNELVGSDKVKLDRLVKEGDHTVPTNSIGVAASLAGRNIQVKYTIKDTKGQLLNIAFVQKKVETNVKSGENSGKKLTHINVVRELKTIAATSAGSVTFALPAGLSANDCSVIAFTQSAATLEVTGAVSATAN